MIFFRDHNYRFCYPKELKRCWDLIMSNPDSYRQQVTIEDFLFLFFPDESPPHSEKFSRRKTKRDSSATTGGESFLEFFLMDTFI
jgi:hypothetical protein